MQSIFAVLSVVAMCGLSANSAPLSADVPKTCKQSTIDLFKVNEDFFAEVNTTNMFDIADLDSIIPENGIFANASVPKWVIQAGVWVAGGPRKAFEAAFNKLEEKDTNKIYIDILEKLPDETKNDLPKTTSPKKIKTFLITCFGELSDKKLDRILYGKH